MLMRLDRSMDALKQYDIIFILDPFSQFLIVYSISNEKQNQYLVSYQTRASHPYQRCL